MTLCIDERRSAMLEEMGLRFFPARATLAEPVLEPVVETVLEAAEPDAPTAPQASPREFPAEAATALRSEPVPARPPVPIARERVSRDAVETMSWDELQQAAATCQACKLCESRRNVVFGVGDPQADWLIVGEAPGENEDLQGEPFVGQAGKLLDNMLRAIGLSRAQNVYIANVLKCRPPGNRNPEVEEVAQCEPFLRRQVQLLQPRIILAMGRFAVQSLLGTTEPIGKLRGRAHDYMGVPVVVTYHPAYLLRNLPDKAKAWADLCLALEVAAVQPAVASRSAGT